MRVVPSVDKRVDAFVEPSFDKRVDAFVEPFVDKRVDAHRVYWVIFEMAMINAHRQA